MPANQHNELSLNNSRGSFTSSSGNELIPFLTQNNQLLIDARWLHENMQVLTRFNDWIKREINEIKLIKNFDYYYSAVSSNGENSNIRDNSKKQYLFTQSAAILVMSSQPSEVGLELRRRFIKRVSEFMITVDPFKVLIAVIRKGNEWYPFSAVRQNLGMKKCNSILKVYERCPEDFYFDGEKWMVSKRYCLIMAHRRTASNDYKHLPKGAKNQIQPTTQMQLPFIESAKNEGGNHA